MNKRLSKYIAAFDFVEMTLLLLSATSGGISIALFTSVICTPVGIIIASLGLVFSFTKGIKKVKNNEKNKKQ